MYHSPSPTELYERRRKLARLIRSIGVAEAEGTIRHGFCTRVQTALKDLSLRQILVADEGELLKVRNFGRKSLNDLRHALEDYGLTIHLGPTICDDLGFK